MTEMKSKTYPVKVEIDVQTKAFEKPFYRSKKWIAWVVEIVALNGLAVLALLTQSGWALGAFLIVAAIIQGAVTFGLIDRQATMDKFLRGIALSAGKMASGAGRECYPDSNPGVHYGPEIEAELSDEIERPTFGLEEDNG